MDGWMDEWMDGWVVCRWAKGRDEIEKERGMYMDGWIAVLTRGV
jgi:hypothetical protein